MLILQMGALRPMTRQTIVNGHKIPPRIIGATPEKLIEIIEAWYWAASKTCVFDVHHDKPILRYQGDRENTLETPVLACFESILPGYDFHWIMRYARDAFSKPFSEDLGFIAIPIPPACYEKAFPPGPAPKFRDNYVISQVLLEEPTPEHPVLDFLCIVSQRNKPFVKLAHPSYKKLYFFGISAKDGELGMDPHIVIAHPSVFIPPL